MKSRSFLAILLVSTLITTSAFAREPVPIVNHYNVAVSNSSGKAPAIEQVKQAILAAAATKSWSASHQPDGKILASLLVRGKHTIVVEITYSGEMYSLAYKDSTNMKFGEKEGQKVIHPNYNIWTKELKEAIRIELLKT